jgi:hypothetical protein
VDLAYLTLLLLLLAWDAPVSVEPSGVVLTNCRQFHDDAELEEPV